MNKSLPPGQVFRPIHNYRKIIRDDRLVWLESLQKKYGDIFQLIVIKERTVIVNHPDLAKEILTQPVKFDKSSIGFDFIKQISGVGLLTSEGEIWKKHRKLFNPHFHNHFLGQMTDDMLHTIEVYLDKLYDQLPQEATVDFFQLMNQLTLAITFKSLFGKLLTNKEIDDTEFILEESLHGLDILLKYPFLDFFENKTKSHFQNSNKKIRTLTHKLVTERIESNERNEDLLQIMIDAYHEGEMTLEQILNEVITFINTGYETTSHSLSWYWSYMLNHPEWMTKIEAEINQLPDITFEHLKSCSQIRNTFMESLRLSPTVPLIPRRNRKDAEIGGYRIPKYAEILINVHHLCRRPEDWENPLTFNPDRFAVKKQRHAFAYLPWGGGMRKCIGAQFSMMEASLIIIAVLKRFKLSLPPQSIQPKIAITQRPSQLNLLVSKR